MEQQIVLMIQSPLFDLLSSGQLLWGDVDPPAWALGVSQPKRDFSALAGRGNPFASLNRREKAMAVAAAAVAQKEETMSHRSDCCGPCDGHCWDDHESEGEPDFGCEWCGAKDKCRCCDGCVPGCAYCDPNFNPADPWGDGAPEEHRGFPWGDDDDDEDLYYACLCS
jgi:hypothetical protein